MPTYLLHGFRWHRANIRIHIILQNLDDAAPEWIVAPATSNTLLNSFYSLFDFLPPSNPPTAAYPPPPPLADGTPETTGDPRLLKKGGTYSKALLRSLGSKKKSKPVLNEQDLSPSASESGVVKLRRTNSTRRGGPCSNGKLEKPPSFNDWSVVKLVEQYDPDDLHCASQPYAYVADYMIEVALGASLSEEMGKYEERLKSDEAPMSTPASPATSAMPASGDPADVQSPGFSARDRRRKSRRLGWFEKLRDELQKGEDIGWYVVVCGDEERVAPPVDLGQGRPSTSTASDTTAQETPRKSGLKGIFSKKKSSLHE